MMHFDEMMANVVNGADKINKLRAVIFELMEGEELERSKLRQLYDDSENDVEKLMETLESLKNLKTEYKNFL